MNKLIIVTLIFGACLGMAQSKAFIEKNSTVHIEALNPNELHINFTADYTIRNVMTLVRTLRRACSSVSKKDKKSLCRKHLMNIHDHVLNVISSSMDLMDLINSTFEKRRQAKAKLTTATPIHHSSQPTGKVSKKPRKHVTKTTEKPERQVSKKSTSKVTKKPLIRVSEKPLRHVTQGDHAHTTQKSLHKATKKPLKQVSEQPHTSRKTKQQSTTVSVKTATESEQTTDVTLDVVEATTRSSLLRRISRAPLINKKIEKVKQDKKDAAKEKGKELAKKITFLPRTRKSNYSPSLDRTSAKPGKEVTLLH